MKNRSYYLDVLYKATDIPFHIINTNQQVTLSYPNINIPCFIKYAVAKARAISDSKDRPVILSLPGQIFIGYLRINDNTRILFGPVTTLTGRQLSPEGLKIKDMSESERRDINNLLAYMSPCSVTSLKNAMILAAKINNDLDLPADSFLISYVPEEYETSLSKAEKKQAVTISVTDPHTPWDYEQQMTDYIENGDFDGLVRYLQAPVPGTIGILSFNRAKDAAYQFIVTVTIACRAALRGGADSEAAYSYSDSICRQMDSSGASYTDELVLLMLKTYCDMVKDANHDKSDSKLVKDCRYYTSAHLQEEIRLTDLADYCGLSPRVLSRKYREETGESVMDYIQKTKLKEAYRMLRYTSSSVSEISSYLGYGSQSYFTVIFKKFTGCTPGEFRGQNHSRSS